MNELRILVGVPGSGKSTYANQLVKSEPSFVKLSRDEFRHMLKDAWFPGEEVEHLVTALIDGATKSALSKGFDVILDNTHCTLRTLKDTIRKWGKESRIVIKYIGEELTPKQLRERNNTRDKPVPEAVLDKMQKGFTAVCKAKKDIQALVNEVATSALPTQSAFKQDESLPKALLFDIDGNVAHMNDKRGPFEWHKVDMDDPDENILNLARALSKSYKIVFMSGRDESCRELTIEWLQAYYKNEEIELYMRPKNNFQKDNLVKLDLFNKYVKDKYYIEAVFDDRDQVVAMWRNELGLKCVQTAYGNF
jgi:predicted kinase